ncbi:MAG TPA: hypothetical protein VGK87_01475 [Anaerolineae bacterium]
MNTVKPLSPVAQSRAVLEGVPRIGYDVHLCPLIGSLFSIMQFRGDPCDYDLLMGASGAAFRRLYNRDDGGNIDLMYLHPEPMRRAAIALNYDLHEVPLDRAQMMSAIRDNIAQSLPVIGFGIIGPPEAGIITGYDDGGETLVGWSYFQNDEKHETISIETSGYSRRSHWFELMQHGKQQPGLVVVGVKNHSPGPSRRDILKSTLAWAVDLERTAQRAELPDHICGLAAAEAWAAGLEVDADFPLDNPQALGWRVMIHGDQCTMLEERRNASAFLRKMTGAAGAASPHLAKAAELFQRVADEMPYIWPWGLDMSTIGPKLADRAARRRIAEHIRITAQIESQAVDELEEAIRSLSAA